MSRKRGMDIVGCGGASLLAVCAAAVAGAPDFAPVTVTYSAASEPPVSPSSAAGLLPLPSEEEISSQNTEASSSASTQAPPESHEPPASSSPASSAPPQGKINLNTAGKEELMSIKGLGEILAERILDYRERHGGFDSLEELMEVDGIGGEALCRLETLSDAVAGGRRIIQKRVKTLFTRF